MVAKVKFDPNKMHMLVSSDRRQSLDTHKLLSSLPIMVHHRVADIGCGPGYLTIPLGKYLFNGKVLALDIQQEMLDATRKSLEELNLTNVELARSKESKLPLEDESLDGALMAFVLQEARYPKALLRDALRCLKKSGWLAILEWHKKETDGGPPLVQRIEENEMREMAGEVGFRFRSLRELNGAQYMLLVTK